MITVETRVHAFDGWYFSMDKILPDYIKVFDEQTCRPDSFNIKGVSFEVTDFFLYDLDKDGEPEIFIFNVGKIAGENVVSLDVYSLGKGSVKVGFE